MTYEELEDQAERIFRIAYPDLALNGNLMGTAKQKQEERIENLENAIVTMSKNLQASKTVSETLTKKMVEQEGTVNNLQNNLLELKEQLMETKDFIAHYIEFRGLSKEEKEALRKKFKIKDFPEDEKELMHVYSNILKEYEDENGHISPEASKDIDKRFQAFLQKRKEESKDVDM